MGNTHDAAIGIETRLEGETLAAAFAPPLVKLRTISPNAVLQFALELPLP